MLHTVQRVQTEDRKQGTDLLDSKLERKFMFCFVFRKQVFVFIVSSIIPSSPCCCNTRHTVKSQFGSKLEQLGFYCTVFINHVGIFNHLFVILWLSSFGGFFNVIRVVSSNCNLLHFLCMQKRALASSYFPLHKKRLQSITQPPPVTWCKQVKIMFPQVKQMINPLHF